MILERLDVLDRYATVHPLFADAFSFLRNPGLATVPEGRYAIDGERLYAVVMKRPGLPPEKAVLEAHRRYIDIQCAVDGTDTIGWKPVAGCAGPLAPYDVEKDVQLFSDEPDCWAVVHPGACAIFFPDDAHAPLVGRGVIHKVVVKVHL